MKTVTNCHLHIWKHSDWYHLWKININIFHKIQIYLAVWLDFVYFHSKYIWQLQGGGFIFTFFLWKIFYQLLISCFICTRRNLFKMSHSNKAHFKIFVELFVRRGIRKWVLLFCSIGVRKYLNVWLMFFYFLTDMLN